MRDRYPFADYRETIEDYFQREISRDDRVPSLRSGFQKSRDCSKKTPLFGEAFELFGWRFYAGSYTLNEEPHPQVLFTLGFSNLKPEASRVSTKSTTQPFRYMAEVAST